MVADSRKKSGLRLGSDSWVIVTGGLRLGSDSWVMVTGGLGNNWGLVAETNGPGHSEERLGAVGGPGCSGRMKE